MGALISLIIRAFLFAVVFRLTWGVCVCQSCYFAVAMMTEGGREVHGVVKNEENGHPLRLSWGIFEESLRNQSLRYQSLRNQCSKNLRGILEDFSLLCLLFHYRYW